MEIVTFVVLCVASIRGKNGMYSFCNGCGFFGGQVLVRVIALGQPHCKDKS